MAQERDERGRFAASGSGAAKGDHQRSQTPNAGRGSPVTAHAGVQSVGVEPKADQK